MSIGTFLSIKTPIFNLHLYLIISVIAFAAAVVLLIILIRRRRSRSKKHCSRVKNTPEFISTSTKDIPELTDAFPTSQSEEIESYSAVAVPALASTSEVMKMMENVGWGRWYTFSELEAATAGFSDGNVIGKGGYGIVYRGVLSDFSIVAVKCLLNNKGQAEKEFKVEVEAIGKVRHKNLVGLLGYCAEGPKRLLVFEYIENGNLEQWLRGDVGHVSPLTWDIRMKVAIGIAKGISYLHEGLEPKVIHRDIKSSNILLDKQWNAKVSDFGLAKVLGSDSSSVTTRVMGTFGYVAPEYASTGILNESNDVYSFGVLLMEIISGRSPVDYKRAPGEVNLVDWFRRTVGSRREDDVVDPLVEVHPSPRALKRILLVCLRCTDLDAQKRPKMSQIVRMLEGDEFPFRIEHRAIRETALNSPVAAANRIPLADTERSIMWR